MSMRREDVILRSILRSARPCVLMDFPPDSPIETCGLVRGAMNNVGLNCAFAPVYVVIDNPALTQFIEGNKREPTPEEMTLFGGYRRQVGKLKAEVVKGIWTGHLINVFRDEGKWFMMDMSIDRAVDKAHQIELLPFLIEVPETFIKREESMVVRTDKKVQLTYTATNDTSFTQSQAWRTTRNKLPTLERLTFIVRQKLKRAGLKDH